jgi:hypothetical protein
MRKKKFRLMVKVTVTVAAMGQDLDMAAVIVLDSVMETGLDQAMDVEL